MKVEKVVAFAGNKKYAIAYQDGTVECAYIFLAYRKDFQHIFCISSQIGCPFKCVFCSNSRGRFVRNLTENEIRDQIEILIEHLPILSANRVEIDFMGVGEPLLNLENILPILNSYRSQEDICFGVSTILPKAYFKELLALNYNPRTRLQISVHSALSEKREKLIGISSDFGQLLKAARDFYTKFPFRCVALNICLADGLNDTEEELTAILEERDTVRKYCYIKLSYPNSNEYRISRNINTWIKKLTMAGIPYKVFKSTATQKEMGCGQLTTRLDQ